MFTPIHFIETVQSSKKIAADYLIKNSTLNKAAKDYIDTQTVFAKMMANYAIDLAKYSMDTFTKCVYPQKEQAAQAPYKVEPKARKTKVEETANTDINTQGE